MEIIAATMCSVPLLRVIGDVDHFTSLDLQDAVQAAFRSDDPRLLLDLTECPYLDSGGLGVVLMTLRKVRAKGWLGVIGCSPDLSRVLAISGLTADPDIRVFPSRQEAFATLARETP